MRAGRDGEIQAAKLSILQTVLSIITNFLSHRFTDPSLFDITKQFSVGQWYAICMMGFHTVSSDTRFAVVQATMRFRS